ncbi:MAG: hypothetical protein KDB98_05510, partial [Flavobacteriales bacterium]|nr:hypothetical protein [Flavobacteriales bacterium]
MPLVTFGQSAGLEITGAVKEGWKGLGETNLTLYKNGSVDKSFTTSSNGKFEFLFEPNATYILDVSKPGYVTKKIEFNTTVPVEMSMVWEFDFIVELFQDQSGLDKAIFLNPVAKVHYNRRFNEFDYDLDYTMQFQKQEEEVFKKLEELNEEKYLEEEQARKEAEQKAKEEAKALAAAKKAEEEEAKRKEQEAKAKAEAELKAKEDSYKALVKEAESLMKAESFTEAKAKLEEAKRVFPDRGLEENLAQAEAGIAKVKAEQEERNKVEKQFQDIMSQAEDLVRKEKYEAAINLFETAQDIKPDTDLPKVKIKQAQEKLAAIAKAEEEKKKLDAEYQKLIAEGKEAEGIADYGKAKEKFTEAGKLKPDSEEPARLIKYIDELLARLDKERREAEEKQKLFSDLIAKGDASARDQNFEGAKSNYSEALSLGVDDKLANDKIAEIERIVAERDKAATELAEKQERFSKLLSEGGSLQTSKKLSEAKQKFQDALALNVDNNAAQARIDQVDRLIQEEQRLAEELAQKQKTYDTAIKKADKLLSKESYQEALAEYQEAGKILPQQTYPAEKVAEIQNK